MLPYDIAAVLKYLAVPVDDRKKIEQWLFDLEIQTNKAGGSPNAILKHMTPELIRVLIQNNLRILFEEPKPTKSSDTTLSGTIAGL